MEPLHRKEGDFGYKPGKFEEKQDIFHKPNIDALSKKTKKGDVFASLSKIYKEPALFPHKLKEIADIVKEQKGNLTAISLAIVAGRGINARLAPKEALEIVRKMLLRL